ncbi:MULTISPECIES: AzlD domain-containing protein [unclassified Acinetobacter]|uniref:AzlD family protein n=1 Tax=unclassified Acinetobacter TaxID=196816 RepID=UPI000BC59F32|nr:MULTISPECIES: AzlD domain-containing protein [unclassified Acinetobacter]PCN59532.1 branched-chain amino acid transporter [Acinetobacter sp. YT-02]
MNHMLNLSHPVLIVLVMAIVTLITRWGGVMIMQYVPITESVQRFIYAMSASVLVAVLTPIAVTGDTAARWALLCTAVLMLMFKKPLWAIAAGILVAAVYRQYML